MIQRAAANTRSHRLNWANFANAAGDVRYCDVATGPVEETLVLRRGESFFGPSTSALMTIKSGLLSLEVTTASGAEFCLSQLRPGDIILPLDLIKSPAFSLSYTSDERVELLWLESDISNSDRSLELERIRLTATTDLLGTCIRMIHELACLPAPHRLYCELLRMASRDAGRDALGYFNMPTHSALATRLCTTRETISRELSFLRLHKVIESGKRGQILDATFLLSRLASTFDLPNIDDVWAAIGVKRLPARR